MDEQPRDEHAPQDAGATHDSPAPPPPTPPPPPAPAPPARAPVLCASCRYDISSTAVGGACPECGTPIMQSGAPQLTQGKAIAAMVLGICSIPGCFMYGIPGIVCGLLAVSYARKAEIAIQLGQAPITSAGYAKAGRVLGWIGFPLSVVYTLFWVAYFAFIILMIVMSGGGGGGGPAFGP